VALGFPPSYKSTSSLAGDRASARAGVAYAFDVLGWQYSNIDPDHFQARVPYGFWSWGESFSVSITDGMIEIQSASMIAFQVFDWGRNKQNVEEFVAHYLPKEARDALLGSNDPRYLSDNGKTPVQRVMSD
jgi:hypothetical protein